jgi:hypothetical protein
MKETTDEQKATEERVFQDRQYQVANSFFFSLIFSWKRTRNVWEEKQCNSVRNSDHGYAVAQYSVSVL